MSTTSETCDEIIEFLLYRYDKRFVIVEVLQQAVNKRGNLLSNAIRQICTSTQAMRYTRRGEYEIVDLESYFAAPAPGADDRYHTPQLRT